MASGALRDLCGNFMCTRMSATERGQLEQGKHVILLDAEEIVGLLCVDMITAKIYTLTICSKNNSVIALISGPIRHQMQDSPANSMVTVKAGTRY